MSEAWRDRRVLITGGLGFIGSNLTLRLVDLGARVSIIDLPEPDCAGSAGNIAPIADCVRLWRANLCEPGSWFEAVADCEFVFHLAAQVSHIDSMADPVHDLDWNCRALLNVLAAVKQSPRPPKVIFTSTRQVYGRAESLPIREDSLRRPTDLNGIHKVAAEEYLRVYREAFGIRSTTLRLANTFGPRMDLRNSGRGVLNVFIAKALRGEPLQIFGDGSQRRDMTYVDDVVEALLRSALIDDSGPFNVGSVQSISLCEFIAALKTVLPVDCESLPFPAHLKAIDIGDSSCDIGRIQRATGWAPTTSLIDGLRATIDYFQRTAPPVANAVWQPIIA